MAQFAGQEYKLLRDYDRGKFGYLSFEDKIDYLERRVRWILLDPCLKEMPNEPNSMGLILTTALCAGISAAASFLNGQRAPARKDGEYFIQFVKGYMDPVLQDELVPGTTIAAWLYQKVRCGLAHAFTIENGGIEIGLTQYIEIKNGEPEIDPVRLAEDFARGWQAYLDQVRAGGQSSDIGQKFVRRLDEIFRD